MSKPAARERPNILMIVTDQQRRDTVGAYGSRTARTPVLDDLARQGMTFTNAFTPCGLCTPARSSMLTGVYPHTHEVLTNTKLHPVRTELQPHQDRLGEPLRDAGYRLGYVGKWHVNSRHTPLDFGFERYVSLEDYGTYRRQLGVPLPPAARNYFQTVSGVDPIPAEHSRPAFLADRAIDMVAEFSRDAASPFFIRLDFQGPHPPNVVPEPYASMYEPCGIPPHANFADDLSGKPAVQRVKRRHWGTDAMTWEQWQPLVAHYFGEVTLIDTQIGRVLAALERAGRSEDTLVLFFSDHGDTMGAHGIWNKDYTMYDEIYRVPLIARWSGVIDPGAVCRSYVHHAIDLLPTLLEAARLEAPAGIHGLSLIPLFRGERQERPNEAYCEFHGCHMGLYSLRMLQTDRYKYVFHTNDIDELYDHQTDPHELCNLAESAEHADVLLDLRLRMVDWMSRTQDHLHNEWIVYWLTGDPELALQAPGRSNSPW